MKRFLSKKCRDIKPSLMMKMAAMAGGVEGCIDLTLGEPDIPTPRTICDALCEAARREIPTTPPAWASAGFATPFPATGREGTV